MLVKVLGAIDLLSAILFLMITFSLTPFTILAVFCSILLLLKGMFIFTGEVVLSLVDLFSGILLILSIFLTLPAILVWVPAFLLLAKSFVSFM